MVGRILSRREALSIAARAGLVLAAVRLTGCRGGDVESSGYSVSSGSGPGAAGSGADIHAGPVIATPVNLVASPSVTEGPFFVDEKLNRSELVRVGGGAERASVVNGLPLALTFQV